MNPIQMEKWSELTKKAREPFQAMHRLNTDALQRLHYMQFEDWARMNKPEEFFETQMTMMLKNAHNAIEYFQKTFQIFENTVSDFLDSVREKTDNKRKIAVSSKKSKQKAKTAKVAHATTAGHPVTKQSSSKQVRRKISVKAKAPLGKVSATKVKAEPAKTVKKVKKVAKVGKIAARRPVSHASVAKHM